MSWTSRLLPGSVALVAAIICAAPAVAAPTDAAPPGSRPALSSGVPSALDRAAVATSRTGSASQERLATTSSTNAAADATGNVLAARGVSGVGASATPPATSAAAGVAAAGTPTAPSPVPPTSPTDQPGVGVPNPVSAATAFLRPGATGTTCTAAAPCGTLGAALKVVGRNAATIEVAAGTYGSEDLYGQYLGDYGPVTVRPAPGAVATFTGKLMIARPNITLDHLAFSGLLYVYPAAINTTVYRAHFSGPGVSVLLRSSYGRVAGSIIEGGFAHDGVNVAGTRQTTGNVIEQNTIRNFAGGPAGAEHPDCIQIFDTSNLVIRRNILTNCYNSAITFSRGAALGVSNVQITSNFLTGCIAEVQRCGNGGSSIDLRLAVTGVTFANNTVGRGSVRMPYQAGVTAPNNIIGYFSTTDCTTSLQSSLVMDYSTSMCKAGLPGAARGNWLATVTFVDPVRADLRVVGGAPRNGGSGGQPPTPVDPTQGAGTVVNPSGKITYSSTSGGDGVPTPPATTADSAMLDIDGTPFLPGVVGASNL